MTDEVKLIVFSLLSLLVAMAVAFVLTPVVKSFAQKVGAMDVPKDSRRMHTVPIPRLGGLAIFLGFMVSVIIFADINRQMQGILMGAAVIVVLGVIDDIMPLPAWLKFIVQIMAALIAVYYGVRIESISNPNIFSSQPFLVLGGWSVPITVLWIVLITNSVNLIDGLDGLAVGVSTICSLTMLAIAVMVSEPNVAIVVAALAGGCIGFLPYNINPAKIFMGDTGATFLGFILATLSVQGLFKFYAVISFAVPFLILGLPIFDTVFAFIRRAIKGQNPMHADRSHVHHRLIDMGLSQKQAVAVLYVISAILGVCAVVLTTSGELKAMLLLITLCIFCGIGATGYLAGRRPAIKKEQEKQIDKTPEAENAETGKTDAESKTAEAEKAEEGKNGEN